MANARCQEPCISEAAPLLFDTPDLVTMKSGSIHWRRRRKQQEHGQGEQVGLGARVDGMDEGCLVGAK